MQSDTHKTQAEKQKPTWLSGGECWVLSSECLVVSRSRGSCSLSGLGGFSQDAWTFQSWKIKPIVIWCLKGQRSVRLIAQITRVLRSVCQKPRMHVSHLSVFRSDPRPLSPSPSLSLSPFSHAPVLSARETSGVIVGGDREFHTSFPARALALPFPRLSFVKHSLHPPPPFSGTPLPSPPLRSPHRTADAAHARC